jgi:hypothetical protein
MVADYGVLWHKLFFGGEGLLVWIHAFAIGVGAMPPPRPDRHTPIAFSLANSFSPPPHINSPIAKSNTAHLKSNTAYLKSNSAHLRSNSAYLRSNSAHLKSNSAYLRSNTAHLRSNSADRQCKKPALKSSFFKQTTYSLP